MEGWPTESSAVGVPPSERQRTTGWPERVAEVSCSAALREGGGVVAGVDDAVGDGGSGVGTTACIWTSRC